MALNPQVSIASRNAALSSLNTLINTGGAGTIAFYTGSQPASPDTAVSGQTLLATLALSSTAFATPSAGSMTANAITSASAVATGTAAWWRIASGGGTAVFDGTCGTSGSDINFNSAAISSGQTVAVSSLSVSHP